MKNWKLQTPCPFVQYNLDDNSQVALSSVINT